MPTRRTLLGQMKLCASLGVVRTCVTRAEALIRHGRHRLHKWVWSAAFPIRRRCHSRRSSMVLVSTCLFTILFYHLMITTVTSLRRTRRGTANSISSRYLAASMRQNLNESGNLTQHLWLFKNSDSERIYLYTRLLSEHKWKSNRTNIKLLRYELNTEANVTTGKDLIVTQQNVQVGDELASYVFTRDMFRRHEENFKISEEFVATLPKKSPLQGKHHKRCAVVGNGGSIINTTCGAEIDSMDFVFRCNAAPIDNFKEDAGRKTDFITFNPSILFKHFDGIQNDTSIQTYIDYMNQYENSIIWYPCFGSRKLTDPCLQAVSYRRQIKAHLVMGHPRHYVNMWEFWKRKGLKKRLSTGLYLTNVAATMCDEIHLYGFWPFPVQLRQNFTEIPYHYFNDIPFTNHHSSDTEFRILLQLHMLGVVNLHTGKCKTS